jgi:hypothetical protein
MKVCYSPHNTTAYPEVTKKLESKEAYVYIKNRLGKDPCIFVKNSVDDDRCLVLSLVYNETNACGTVVGYPQVCSPYQHCVDYST